MYIHVHTLNEQRDKLARKQRDVTYSLYFLIPVVLSSCFFIPSHSTYTYTGIEWACARGRIKTYAHTSLYSYKHTHIYTYVLHIFTSRYTKLCSCDECIRNYYDLDIILNTHRDVPVLTRLMTSSRYVDILQL